jgi:hypothetical protein
LEAIHGVQLRKVEEKLDQALCISVERTESSSFALFVAQEFWKPIPQAFLDVKKLHYNIHCNC